MQTGERTESREQRVSLNECTVLWMDPLDPLGDLRNRRERKNRNGCPLNFKWTALPVYWYTVCSALAVVNPG